MNILHKLKDAAVLSSFQFSTIPALSVLLFCLSLVVELVFIFMLLYMHLRDLLIDGIGTQARLFLRTDAELIRNEIVAMEVLELYLHPKENILGGCFKLSDLFSLRCLSLWINRSPPVCWSIFDKPILYKLVCKFKRMNNNYSLLWKLLYMDRT